MEFTIDEQFITDNNLTPEQVTAITGNVTTYHTSALAEAKKGWDGKANADAEGILNGAAESIAKLTGFQRESGQKIADYIEAAHTGYLSAKTEEVDKLKAGYEDKLKNFKGDPETAKALEETRLKLDSVLQKYADYESLKETADKYTPLAEKYEEMKLRNAYGSVKPNFPDTVNSYEAEAKWNEFVASVQKTYIIELDGSKAIAIDKDNKHNIVDLKSLVEKDESLQDLTKGRQQNGAGAKPQDLKKIEGIPFSVPAELPAKKRAELIRDYLTKEGLNIMSQEYSARFAELNKTILQKTAS